LGLKQFGKQTKEELDTFRITIIEETASVI